MALYTSLIALGGMRYALEFTVFCWLYIKITIKIIACTKGSVFMKKTPKIISGVLVVGLLATISIMAFAASEAGDAAAVNSENPAGSKPLFDKASRKGEGFHIGERTELTDEQKAEMTARMKDRLAQQLSDGKITQEQYDQCLTSVVDGKMPMPFGRAWGDKERVEFTDEQKADMTANMKERLAQHLSDGKITQEQYDQTMTDLADGKMPMPFGWTRDHRQNDT